MRILLLCLICFVGVGCESAADRAKALEERRAVNGDYYVKSVMLDQNYFVVKAQHVRYKTWRYFFLKPEENGTPVAIPNEDGVYRVEWNDAIRQYDFIRKEEGK